MTGQKAAHVIFDSPAQAMLCKHCGCSERLEMPIPIDQACICMATFVKQHMDCQPIGIDSEGGSHD